MAAEEGRGQTTHDGPPLQACAGRLHGLFPGRARPRPLPSAKGHGSFALPRHALPPAGPRGPPGAP